ncbi:hypothetical protein [Okeania sp. KiyG1]|uniref:hypothetical protein n=1 Tax=Okeania sp. KiyG1 TaxID=2720165 RepID=UPI0019209F03|nr:hypothetical protein [Okeania sp. KiyG1]GGA03850.1 hypothetical protein CYANOKiyG1_16070 [Okeania sp. KiyG1]
MNIISNAIDALAENGNKRSKKLNTNLDTHLDTQENLPTIKISTKAISSGEVAIDISKNYQALTVTIF